MAKKTEVAETSDLDRHISTDWKAAHGIWGHVPSAAPIQIATPMDLMASFTWDAGWHDIDLTAQTSATARWAIMAVACRRTGGNMDVPPQFGKYGETTAYIILRSTEADDDNATGSVVWIPMDSQQRFSYKLPSNSLDSLRIMNLLGYV
jgi:hypothetical protein